MLNMSTHFYTKYLGILIVDSFYIFDKEEVREKLSELNEGMRYSKIIRNNLKLGGWNNSRTLK